MVGVVVGGRLLVGRQRRRHVPGTGQTQRQLRGDRPPALVVLELLGGAGRGALREVVGGCHTLHQVPDGKSVLPCVPSSVVSG